MVKYRKWWRVRQLNKTLLVLFLFACFFLSACQSKTIFFNGQSESWSAKVRVIRTGDTQEQNTVLKYQGNDIQNVEGQEIKYFIEDGTGSSIGTGILSKGGVLQSKNLGDRCKGCAFITEDSEIVITLEWDDQKESIALRKE